MKLVILLLKSSLNPSFCWDQDNPDFWDQKYPKPTKKFWTAQTEDWITWSNRYRNTFSRFEPIWSPKSDQITNRALVIPRYKPEVFSQYLFTFSEIVSIEVCESAAVYHGCTSTITGLLWKHSPAFITSVFFLISKWILNVTQTEGTSPLRPLTTPWFSRLNLGRVNKNVVVGIDGSSAI